jgi:hypothetical protein
LEWEIGRHDWTKVGQGQNLLPGWIVELVATGDSERANQLLSLIESAVVPVNGPMVAGADAAVSCLVQGLWSATSVSRCELLYLLFQFAGGVVDVPESDLVRNVQRELSLGFPAYSEIAETGNSEERFQCIDLLSLCVRFNGQLAVRATWIMCRIAELGEKESSAVSAEFADLENDGYNTSG